MKQLTFFLPQTSHYLCIWMRLVLSLGVFCPSSCFVPGLIWLMEFSPWLVECRVEMSLWKGWQSKDARLPVARKQGTAKEHQKDRSQEPDLPSSGCTAHPNTPGTRFLLWMASLQPCSCQVRWTGRELYSLFPSHFVHL